MWVVQLVIVKSITSHEVNIDDKFKFIETVFGRVLRLSAQSE